MQRGVTMAAKNMIWTGTGGIYFGDFDLTNGVATSAYLINLKKVACGVVSLTTSISVEKEQVYESCTQGRGVIGEFPTSKTIEASIVMQQFSRDELALALQATSSVVAATTPAQETWPTVAVGNYVFVKHPQASSIVVKDSAGTPATLVLDTDYEITDADQGVIKILGLAAYTQPFTVDYDNAEYGNLSAMGEISTEKGILFTGLNHEGTFARVIIPRIPMAQDGDFSWVGEGAAELTLSGSVLYVEELDTVANVLYGGYMRVDNLPEV